MQIDTTDAQRKKEVAEKLFAEMFQAQKIDPASYKLTAVAPKKKEPKQRSDSQEATHLAKKEAK